MGWHQFISIRSPVREGWCSVGKWCLAHQPSWVGCRSERRQPSTTVAGKEVASNSLCVYHWVSDMLTGKASIRTKAASEMLIRRRLHTLKSLVSEYDLTVGVTLVASYCNLANQLTRVPHKWYIAWKMGAEPGGQTCTVTASTISQ